MSIAAQSKIERSDSAFGNAAGELMGDPTQEVRAKGNLFKARFYGLR
ncbi:MAG: hypothetical protein H0U23_15720 [Blastocatellia bacterium]|nr:hypothetical protein [Blastocatellia bacterium]